MKTRNWRVYRYINGDIDRSFSSHYFDEEFAKRMANEWTERANISITFKAAQVKELKPMPTYAEAENW